MDIKAAGGAKKDNLVTFLFHLEDHIFIFFLQGMAVVTVGTRARGRGRAGQRGGWRGSPRMRPTRRSTAGTGDGMRKAHHCGKLKIFLGKLKSCLQDHVHNVPAA